MKLPIQTDLTGKVAVVTGAGGVLCGMFAKALAACGAKVALLDLNEAAAQAIADELIALGIKAIWNFAHTDLNVPDDVVVENVHLSESLMRLTYRVCSKQDERERKEREKLEKAAKKQAKENGK